MNDYLRNPLEFVLTVIFQFFILAVLLRFLLQWVRADFYNPLSQAIVRLTNPALRPLRRLIPGLGGIDVAALVLVLALQILLAVILTALRGGAFQPLVILLWSVSELVALTLNIFIFSIIIQSLLSWITPGHHSPASALLHRLNEPLLGPARRLLPPFSGLDLSPLLVILLLQVVKMLVMPLFGMALR